MKYGYIVVLGGLFLSNSMVGRTREEEFTRIYREGIWGKNEQGEGTSGGGSTLPTTQIYVDFLQKFIKEHDITTVVDAGCGAWEFSRTIDWSNIDYIGYDIVKFVVEKNIKNFAAPNIQFRHANVVGIDLPPADLLICKDVLQHLGEHENILFLRQLKKYKYCLITNDVHLINILQSPYNVPGKVVMQYASTPAEIKQVVLVEH